ncbi:insulinase family protein [Prevotella sp. PINT]|uniref:M16 family metallopeptidase n=1 Tax=Palleniella intestinalis TaxID=2736291 RepID=UPI0015518E0F|nr:M16 family metallopeptidase [Palleniella intestinalis]NPD81213.1 insulinase family protein [Palleniella intestinalis]
MKKLFLPIAVFAMVMTINAKEHKYVTVPGDPMQTRLYTMPNGLKVYLSVNKEKPRVTAHIAVNTGHRNDPADCTGLAHYLEHLMFKGSKKFGTTDYNAEKPYIDKITSLYEEYRKLTDPAERKAKYHEIDSVSQIAAQYNIPNEYDKLMAAIGGDGSNAYTSFDVTCYTEDIPANEIQRWAEIQSDRFQNLVMRGFHTELEAVYEEKNMSLTNDDSKLFDAVFAQLFPSHSYGTQTTIGTQDHLKNPSLVEIQKYYDRYYKPNNIAICMAGDFDCDKVMDILEEQFGSWQPGKDTTPRQFAKQPLFTQPKDTTVVGQEKEQIMMAWRFDGAASHQCDTLEIISDILMNGRCGLVDLNINQKMLMQSAEAGSFSLKDYSILIMGGAPKEGQSLDEIRNILLGEVKKLKAGDFDDDLIISIINNRKRQYLQKMENNSSRVRTMVNTFINNQPWKDQVHQIERMSKITKTDIVAFANKYLTDGYVCGYKLKGEDKNIKKIEKPAITPIPANRDKASKFLTDITSRTTEPIHPQFVDFNTDLTKVTTKTKLPMLYVQNKENGLFQLVFRYEFGDRADVRYSVINDYIPLLGTSKMSNAQIKKQFYKLACDYNISVGNTNVTVRLAGLDENMEAALALLESIINDSKADKNVYDLYVENTLKERAESKKNQRTCFSYLWEYAMHGAKNDYTNMLSESELKATAPEVFTDLLKGLSQMKHTVLYYGPRSVKDIAKSVEKNHKVAKRLADVPANKEWAWTTTETPQVIIAPYKANNIYLRMLNNEKKPLDVAAIPTTRLFNEYFGGGMNAIVFQELRETRGLAYNAAAFYSTPSRKEDPQYWVQHIISQNDKMMDCVNTFKEITDNMPQTEANFNIAKQSILKNIASERTTKMNIIYKYLNAQRMGIDHDINKDIYNAVPDMTLQTLVDFEQTNIKGKPLHYVILGDEKELDIKAIEQVAPVKRVTLEEIFGY